jgi:hypothetical protein
LRDLTVHAEMLVIKQAAKVIGDQTESNYMWQRSPVRCAPGRWLWHKLERWFMVFAIRRWWDVSGEWFLFEIYQKSITASHKYYTISN